MTAQVLFFDVFSKKDPHLNAVEYDYIKSHYGLITIDLSRQKEFDPDPKATKQIEFVGKLKKNRWWL